MKKFQIMLAATMAIGGLVLPSSSLAQAPVKHRKLKTAAAGVAAYELAKHSHNKFLKKHKLAAGIAGAYAANKMMKAHDKKAAAAHGH